MAIYAIQAGKDGPIKFGIAVHVERRLGNLQVGNHAELTLLGKCETMDDVKAEKRIHAKLAGSRVRGEWFRPGPATDGAVLAIANGLLDQFLQGTMPSNKTLARLALARYRGNEFALLKHCLRKLAPTVSRLHA